MSTPGISSGAVLKLVTAIRELGVDPTAYLAEASIDPALLDDRDARVPVASLHALWDAVQRDHPRADAALEGARRYSPGDYGLVGFVSMNSATLGEGLGHAVRYLHLWTDDPGMVLFPDGTLEVRYRTPFDDGPGLRLATEAALAEILQGARLLTQSALSPSKVWFTHPAPTSTTAWDAFFGTKVSFGAERTAMRFSEEQLRMPLPRADAQLGLFLQSLANDALAKRSPVEESPLERVRQLIGEELQRGVPELGTIARRLAVSERTLRRRLAEESTTFRDLLDETRASLAREYVRDRRMQLSEVAFMLGFSEPSAFHRAFRRWTGRTPAEWRADHR